MNIYSNTVHSVYVYTMYLTIHCCLVKWSIFSKFVKIAIDALNLTSHDAELAIFMDNG